MRYDPWVYYLNELARREAEDERAEETLANSREFWKSVDNEIDKIAEERNRLLDSA